MTLELRPAALSDRRLVYEMMACSDATPEMMGPPDYSDHPVPDYGEFCADYGEDAFTSDRKFRIFFIRVEGRDIGVINYCLADDVAEIDMWIADRRNWCRGYGSAAITRVADNLAANTTARLMIIRPSARNRRAIAAYRKGGFRMYDPTEHVLPDWCLSDGFDYFDAIVMVRELR